MTTVMHIINELDAGGAERVLARIVAYNSKTPDLNQIAVSLMDEGVYGPDIRAAGAELHCLGMRRGVAGVPNGILRLVRLLRNKRPDAVISWLYHADFMATLAVALSGIGLRRLAWNIRCAEMDLKQYGRSTRLIFRFLCMMSSAPAVVAANSHAGKKYHQKCGYHPKRWVFLPNGFDCDEWQPDAQARTAFRSELQISDQTALIGMVARRDPAKDHDTLFQAINICKQRNRDVHLVLIGHDTETLPVPAAIKKNVSALGLRRDVAKIVPAFDLAVLSSSFGEGFPNVIGEAMACGVPAIGNDVGDVADILGDTGKTVALAAPMEMADAICQLLDESNAAKLARRTAARRRIVDHYSLQSMNTRYLALWKTLAGEQEFRSSDFPD